MLAPSTRVLTAPIPLGVDRPHFHATTASVTPSLDPPESSVESPELHAISHPRYGPLDAWDSPAASELEQNFRHRTWAATRTKVYQSLCRVGTRERALDAFSNCGASLWLARDGPELFLVANHCHNRHCEACCKNKRAALVAAVSHQLKTRRQRCRFLTFTLKCQPVPLVDQLDRLLASFRRLRQRQFWKKLVTGGAFFVEIKLGANSNAWHVHLHVLAEGLWIDQKKLSAEWHAVTGDSFIVDCRAIAEDAKVASYVAKYATKPLHSAVIDQPDKLDECIVSVRGRRLIQCFGTWKSLDVDEPAPSTTRVMLDRVDVLFRRASEGDAEARRFAEAALRKWPSLSSFVVHPTLGDDADPAP